MITLKNNQVLSAVSDFDCDCGDDYKQPFEISDSPTLWVELPVVGSNYVLGTFASSSGWTIGANWAISGGKATYTSGATNALSRDTDIPLVAGYYLVKFDYTSLGSGGLNLTVSLGGVDVSSLGGVLATGFVSQTFYLFKYLTPSNNTLSFSAATYNFSIDNVEVYRLSEAGFKIKQCDTDTVVYTETDNSSVDYYETGNILNGENIQNIINGYAIITLNFTTYSIGEGCFYICFNDLALSDAEFVRNGGFADSDFWTISNTGANGWAIGSGVATHTVGGTAGNDTLSQDVNLSDDLCYSLTFDVASVSGSGDKVFSIYDQDDVLLESVTVSSFPSTVEILISNKTVTTLKIVCNAAGLRNASIDNVSITYDSCEACVQTDCFALKTSWDAYASARRMCNILVSGYSEQAWDFPVRYTFLGRVFGKLRNARYPDVEDVEYKDFSGLVTLEYNDNEKIKELQIYEVPERTHDWLRLALRSQTLTLEINGVSKTFKKVGGDYTPNWRKTSTLAPVIVELKETQQIAPNLKNAP